MNGIVTEKNWREIETVFPGMKHFYERLAKKPDTFLELEWRFLDLRNSTDKKTRRLRDGH